MSETTTDPTEVHFDIDVDLFLPDLDPGVELLPVEPPIAEHAPGLVLDVDIWGL